MGSLPPFPVYEILGRLREAELARRAELRRRLGLAEAPATGRRALAAIAAGARRLFPRRRRADAPQATGEAATARS